MNFSISIIRRIPIERGITCLGASIYSPGWDQPSGPSPIHCLPRQQRAGYQNGGWAWQPSEHSPLSTINPCGEWLPISPGKLAFLSGTKR
jgi:hypothetical protein